MNYSIRSPDEFVSMPWKNGQGTTVELLKKPEHDTLEFHWRLSMAEVTKDGEFSHFNGYDRTLVLLEGDGMTLSHQNGSEDVLLNPLQLARFRGDERTFAKLHSGTIKDFNVMVQRSFCRARVSTGTVSCVSTLTVSADLLMIYAVDNDLLIQESDDRAITVKNQHLLVSSSPASALLTCSGAGFIAVQISYEE